MFQATCLNKLVAIKFSLVGHFRVLLGAYPESRAMLALQILL